VTDREELVAALASRLDPAWATVVRGPMPDAVGLPKGLEVLDLHGPDLVLVDAAGSGDILEGAAALAARLRHTPTAVVVLSAALPPEARTDLYRSGVVACVSPEEGAEELAAHVTSLLESRRPASEAIRRLRTYTKHLDEQLRLAQRLQMDFLPRTMPVVASARFAARLEPAAWVAGDFYDIFRLDERHVAFYVADAIGHGIPAALLTVFVKKSLQAKRIEGKRYELVAPDEALRLLNLDLLGARLQETPFITMVYGLYNEETRECVYAVGGHPRPLLLGRGGALEELQGEGPLLGIFRDARFDLSRRRLAPGQRLLLYTDGAERVDPPCTSNPERLFEVIRASALLPIEAMLDAVLDTVRAATGGSHLADDVTLLALELDERPR
jgi:sigma-B regulation protein RsbU (phosphoserine phosphatase)